MVGFLEMRREAGNWKRALGLLERHSGEYSCGPFCGWEPSLDLCGLALSWIDGEPLDPEAKPHFEKEA